MDAVKFLEERKRKFIHGEPVPALGADIDCNYEDVVKEIEEWSAAHPLKTHQSLFLEQYPNARLDSEGIITICPELVYGETECAKNCNILCYDCRHKFWPQEVKE